MLQLHSLNSYFMTLLFTCLALEKGTITLREIIEFNFIVYNEVLTLPQFLYLPMEFSVGICTIILLVINLPMKSLTKMLRR